MIASNLFRGIVTVMTSYETELVAALEADIKIWEQEIPFFDALVRDVQVQRGHPVSGKEHAASLRRRVQEWRALIERVTKG